MQLFNNVEAELSIQELDSICPADIIDTFARIKDQHGLSVTRATDSSGLKLRSSLECLHNLHSALRACDVDPSHLDIDMCIHSNTKV